LAQSQKTLEAVAMSGRLCNRLSQSFTIMLLAFLNNTRVLVMPKTDEPNNKANAGAGSRILTTGEAAAVLGLSASYLNKMRVTGCGPVFLKLSRAVRYTQADLDAWISSRRHSSTSAAQLALEAEATERRGQKAPAD
jgi:predicted DNA-binding transcriptional regulator AlpA